MLKDDFVIQTNIRRVLIRSNVDYSLLTFGTVRGIVYVQGSFRVSSAYVGKDEQVGEFTSKTLRSLELKVRAVPGVVDVVFQLSNWKKEKGQWFPKKTKE